MKENNTKIEFLGTNQGKKGYVRYFYGIFELPAHERVGDCELRVETELGALEHIGNIGYAVDEDKRCRGHAKNACRMLIGEAENLGISEVFVTCEEKNAASVRICESLGGRLDSSFSFDGKKFCKDIFRRK